jgi:hypothetical protein
MDRKLKRILHSKYFVAAIIFIPQSIIIGYFSTINSSYTPAIKDVHDMLEAYIQANEGDFPESENDLIQQGFFAREENPDGIRYRIMFNPENPDERYYTRYFDEFIIAYGIKFEDIEIRDKKLIDKKTQKQILLIDGPHRNIIGFYTGVSLSLYKKMAELKSGNN